MLLIRSRPAQDLNNDNLYFNPEFPQKKTVFELNFTYIFVSTGLYCFRRLKLRQHIEKQTGCLWIEEAQGPIESKSNLKTQLTLNKK